MKSKDRTAKTNAGKARKKPFPDTLLEALAKQELRLTLQEAVRTGAPPRYVGPRGFLWSELASTVAQCLRLDISCDQFRSRMSGSVEWLANKLVAVGGWGLPPRIPRTSDNLLQQKRPRRSHVTKESRVPSPAVVQHLAFTLRDALGELYGTGHKAAFITSTGWIDWHQLGETVGLSSGEAERAAADSCRAILREIQDYVLSFRDPVERFVTEGRLGLRR